MYFNLEQSWEYVQNVPKNGLVNMGRRFNPHLGRVCVETYIHFAQFFLNHFMKGVTHYRLIIQYKPLPD